MPSSVKYTLRIKVDEIALVAYEAEEKATFKGGRSKEGETPRYVDMYIVVVYIHVVN